MDTTQLIAQHQRKVINHGTLTIVPVAQGIVDIFQGLGWKQHSRYRNYKGRWFWLSGQKLDEGSLPNANA